MKIAQILLFMKDGNSVASHMRVKDHKHAVKKVKKRLKRDQWDMGSISIVCADVADWGYSFEGDVQ